LLLCWLIFFVVFDPIYCLAVGVAYLCCYYIYVLRLWEEVPREFARTTPAKAAGFSLIPFFALYWMFVALVGLYRDMEKMAEANSLGTRFDTTWIVAACTGWLFLHIFALLSGGLFLGSGISVNVLYAIVTVPMLWIIRKNVLEFIDTKSSVGK
jgi:hypothetical protein